MNIQDRYNSPSHSALNKALGIELSFSDQTSIPLQYKMRTHTGRNMLLSSIRPGMRIKMKYSTWLVIQNSAKLKKLEVRCGRTSVVYDYFQAGYNPEFTVLPPSIWYRIKKLFSR